MDESLHTATDVSSNILCAISAGTPLGLPPLPDGNTLTEIRSAHEEVRAAQEAATAAQARYGWSAEVESGVVSPPQDTARWNAESVRQTRRSAQTER